MQPLKAKLSNLKTSVAIFSTHIYLQKKEFQNTGMDEEASSNAVAFFPNIFREVFIELL